MKKNSFIIAIILAFFSVASFGQEKKTERFTLYVKLKNSLESSKELLANIQKSYPVTFEKQILISKTLKGHVYKIIHQLDAKKSKDLNDFLKTQKEVIYTSFQSNMLPSPPNDIPPTTPDFIAEQDYLGPDPGVNAEYAWSQGVDGSNVSVHVIEYGLNVDHEEFVGRNATIASGMTFHDDIPLSWFTHGTATAGVIYSDNGGYGTKGIAFNADSYTLYPEWQMGDNYDRVLAVTRAVDAAIEGDVIVYEMQTLGPDGTLVMAEIDPLVWDLTKIATDNGAIVVAAAGNGDGDLDDVAYDEYRARGDSGAIIVGASYPDTTHNTFYPSTYGTRVNINSWGIEVFSTGYGNVRVGGDDVNQFYTGSFSGTSSATAISSGCVTALQSYYYSISGGQYLTSVEMRDVLVETGIPQTSNSTPIGNFIDMKSAMERLIVLSTSDETLANTFSVFPNPAEDIINIRQLRIQKSEVVIYDLLGKIMKRVNIEKELTPIIISDLNTGIYFVKVTSGSASAIKKIIKN